MRVSEVGGGREEVEMEESVGGWEWVSLAGVQGRDEKDGNGVKR